MPRVESSPIPSLGRESTANRVLAIPELLQVIFDFGTRDSNVSNALVCRSWSGPALDHVWREVDNLCHLLRLLVPLRREGTHYKFDHSPTPEDWAHFIPYARRVHSLKFEHKLARNLADGVFDDLALTRTTLEVLPNLRCLHWHTYERTEHAVVFMHGKVTEFLFIHINDKMPSLVSEVLGRMPSLTSLEWTYSWAQRQASTPSFLQLLSGLQKLRRITLPKYFLDDRLLKAFSSLPELRVIQFNTMVGWTGPFTPVIKGTLEEGAFPVLYDLCLSTTLDDMRHYLTGGVLLPRLKNLSVESMQLESPSMVRRFLADVTECYPALEVISFDVIVDIGQQGACEPLLVEHLRPLISLKQLTRLELRHNSPIQISDEDLAEFGAAFPIIETLVLNPEPLLLTKPKLTLSSLLFISQNFPNLSHLGIYLDAEGVTTRAPYSLAKIQTFPCLRTLNVGVSPIGADHVSVALFLSHLLLENEKVVIQSGFSWDTELFDTSGEVEEEIGQRRSRWQRIEKALPLLLQLRKEMEARRKDIEREIEDLRMRNEVLMRVNERQQVRESGEVHH